MSYDDLETLIGNVKQAAIDAWMQSHSGGFWELNEAEGCYEIRTSSTSTKVTRPGSDGQGGGDWTGNFISELFVGGSRDREFQEGFESVRADIEGVVAKWRNLPNPSDFEDIVSECRSVADDLAPAAANSNGGVNGGGMIYADVKNMEDACEPLTGATMSAFKSKFGSQVRIALGGHYQIALVRGANIAAQQGLWGAAREDVVQALTSAKESFSAAGKQSTYSWGQIVKVFGFAGKGLGLLASTPQGKATVGGVNLALEILSSAAGDTKEVPAEDVGDYDAVLSKFKTVMDEIASTIRAEEQALLDNFSKNTTTITDSKEHYDLSLTPTVDPDQNLRLNTDAIEDVTQTYMPSIQSQLDTIGSANNSCKIAGMTSRSAEVGLDANGLESETDTFTHLLYELNKDLAWEIGVGAQQLDLAVADIMGTDADSERKLKELEANINTGSPYDPWD